MYKFSASCIAKQCEKIRFGSKVFIEEAFGEAAKKLVDVFMQKPSSDEYVAETSDLDMVIYKMVTGTHQSLLITRAEEIVGVLFLVAVFAATFHAMKQLKVT